VRRNDARSPRPADAARAPTAGARWLTLVLLAVATFAVFAGVLRNDWILFDDPLYVYENPWVLRGWTLEGARWFLHEPHGANWHPLTSWSHMLDVELFGLRPGAHHAVSLLLHTLNAVLLVLVLFGMTGAWWRSLLVGALFALHPLRVESVAWAAERKDVLSGLFFLLTLAAYRSWVRRGGAWRYTLVGAGFLLGLMAKPMLVTLPFVLLLLDVWPLGRWGARASGSGPGHGAAAPAAEGAAPRSLARLALEKWPLFLLAVASAVVTFLVQQGSGAVVAAALLGPGRRLANALTACWWYVGRTLWPRDLTVFYLLDRTIPVATLVLGAVAAAAGLVAVTVVAARQARRRPYLAVGWLWFLGMLVPVIGLVQVGRQAYADRYTYLPGIGLLVMLAWGLGELVSRSRARRVVAVAMAVLAVAALSVATARQVARWRDTRTLFTYTLGFAPDNPVAHQNLGDVLLKEGRVRPAIGHYEAVLRVVPDFQDAYNKLGSALGALGRYDEAIARLRQGLALGENAEIRHNLGFALHRQGRLDEAIPQYEAALRLNPGHALALGHLAAALEAQGRFGEAETLLERALWLDPADAEARRLRAVTRVRLGRIEEAVADYHELLRRRPDDLDALTNVAWIRATHADAAHRDGAEAVRLAERARAASPEPVAVLEATLAAAYAEAGRFGEAVRAGERAVALAEAAGDGGAADAYARQLAAYRAGRPFHFAR
jgi:protein O-mannosyl-transferase